MALFKSQLVTQASGSVGGTTYAHTSSGLYMRARSIPVNPNSPYQLQVRASLTELVTRWSETLTPTQRAVWDLYALNVLVPNALGDPFNLSGQNWYIGNSTPRYQSNTKLSTGLGVIDNGPAIFDRGTFETPVAGYDAVTGFSMIFETTDAWNNEVGGAMFIYQGRPANAARNFFKGPWRLIGTIVGDDAVPPVSPFTVSLVNLIARGYPIAANNHVWTAVSVGRADGRLSTRRIVGPTLVTP